GVALSMMLPLLFYLKQRSRNAYLRWPMMALIACTLIADLFTFSRGALLAISAMAIMAWPRSRHKFVSALLAVIVVAGIWTYAPQEWFERMDTIRTYQTDSSAEQRLYMWQLSWAMALKHPIFGAGLRWSYNIDEVANELSGSGFHWYFDGP